MPGIHMTAMWFLSFGQLFGSLGVGLVVLTLWWNPRLLVSFFWYDLRGSFVNIHSVVGRTTLGISFISSNDSSYHVLQWISRWFHLWEMTGQSDDAMATTLFEGSRSATHLQHDRWGSGCTIYLLCCKDLHLQTGCAHEVMMDSFISFSVAWTYRLFD